MIKISMMLLKILVAGGLITLTLNKDTYFKVHWTCEYQLKTFLSEYRYQLATKSNLSDSELL